LAANCWTTNPPSDLHQLDQIERNVCDEAAQIIVCSRFMRQEIHQAWGLPYDKIHVIANGVKARVGEVGSPAGTFLLDHLPPQMHLVITTREDPHLPLARYRVRGQMTELRAADLRFTPTEAAGFLNQVMGLNLSAEEIAALETRTEGWIAGLQMAALALQGSLSMQG
jgi:hypothetical protein